MHFSRLYREPENQKPNKPLLSRCALGLATRCFASPKAERYESVVNLDWPTNEDCYQAMKAFAMYYMGKRPVITP